MNQFLTVAKQAINLHGESCVHTKVTNGTYDPATGSVSNSETNTTVTAYRKHLKATQYNYPNLIGKDAVYIYLPADSIVGLLSISDKFSFGSSTYAIDSIQEHRALNELVMYRVVAYRG